MKNIIIVFLASLLSVLGFSSEVLQPIRAPLNPLFERYLEDLRAGKPWRIVTPEGYYLGYIPEPVELSYGPGLKKPEFGGFPSRYDLRDLGYVTPIRDQGSCGSCWAFATYGSLESWLLVSGQGSQDLSENNLKECHGFDPGPCEGGNRAMSTAYLARRSGPLAETDDPYQDTETGCSPYGRWPGIPVRWYVHDVLYVPPRSGPLDNDDLKWTIMTYGAVATAMYWDSSCYNSSDYTYYYDGELKSNHLIDLVGWDDEKEVPGAPGPGAWIARNSWGTGFGEGGYFYISYYDVVVGHGNAMFINAQVPDRTYIYQYDYLGWVGSWGYGDEVVWAANVFSAKEDSQLMAVAFYTRAVNTSYEIYIKEGGPNGTVLHSQSGSFDWPGYHTVDLSSPVDLNKGETFSVVVKLVTPSGVKSWFPSEWAEDGYSSSAVVNSDESYLSHDGTSWKDMATLDPPSNACIKPIAEPISEKAWTVIVYIAADNNLGCLLYTSPSPRD